MHAEANKVMGEKGGKFWQKALVEGIGNKVRDKVQAHWAPLIYGPPFTRLSSKTLSLNFPHCTMSSILLKPSFNHHLQVEECKSFSNLNIILKLQPQLLGYPPNINSSET